MSIKWAKLCLMVVILFFGGGAHASDNLKFAEPQFEENRQSSRFGEVCELPSSLLTGQLDVDDVVERGLAGGVIKLPTGAVTESAVISITQKIADQSKDESARILLEQFLARDTLEMIVTKVWKDNSLEIKEFSHGGIRLFTQNGVAKFILKDNSDLLVTPADCPSPCILSVKTILGRGYLFKGKNAQFEDYENIFVREFVINRENYREGKWKNKLKVEYLGQDQELGFHIRVRWKLGQTVEMWLSADGEIVKSKQFMDEGILSMNFENEMPELPSPTEFNISDQNLVLITP